MTDKEPDRETWLRNNFYFAYVTQYLNFFYPAFGLDSFTYHDLESLLLEEPDHITGETSNFFKKILKTLPNVRINLTNNWIDALTKEYRKRGYEIPYLKDTAEEGGPEANVDDQNEEDDTAKSSTGPNFESFDLEMRLQILFDLCNFHHENPTYFVEHLLKGYDEGSNWRLEMLGKDSRQMGYWLFEDGRLYRERVDKANLPVDEESWELVCYNRKTWDQFLADGLSNKPGDRRLTEALQAKKKTISDALEIEEAYETRKAKSLMQAAQKVYFDSLPRKRSSRLQEKDAQRQQLLAELAAQEEEERRRKAELHLARTGSLPPVKAPSPSPITHGLSREERAELRRQKIEQEANAKLLKELEEKQAEAERERLKAEGLAEVDVVGEVQHSPKIKLVIRQPTVQESPLHKTPNLNANGKSTNAVAHQSQQQQKPTPSPELIQYLYNMQQQQLQRQLQSQNAHNQQQRQMQQQQLQMHMQQQQHQMQMQQQRQAAGHPQYQHPIGNQMSYQLEQNPQQSYLNQAHQSQYGMPMNQPVAPQIPQHYPSHPNPPPVQFRHQPVYTQAMPVYTQPAQSMQQQIAAPPAAPNTLDALLNAANSQEQAEAKTPLAPNPSTVYP